MKGGDGSIEIAKLMRGKADSLATQKKKNRQQLRDQFGGDYYCYATPVWLREALVSDTDTQNWMLLLRTVWILATAITRPISTDSNKIGRGTVRADLYSAIPPTPGRNSETGLKRRLLRHKPVHGDFRASALAKVRVVFQICCAPRRGEAARRTRRKRRIRSNDRQAMRKHQLVFRIRNHRCNLCRAEKRISGRLDLSDGCNAHEGR